MLLHNFSFTWVYFNIKETCFSNIQIIFTIHDQFREISWTKKKSRKSNIFFTQFFQFLNSKFPEKVSFIWNLDRNKCFFRSTSVFRAFISFLAFVWFFMDGSLFAILKWNDANNFTVDFGLSGVFLDSTWNFIVQNVWKVFFLWKWSRFLLWILRISESFLKRKIQL